MANAKETCHLRPAGVLVFAISTALVSGGMLRFSGTAVVLGLAGFLLLGLARFLGPRTLRGIRLRRRLPHRCHAGDSIPVAVSISHAASSGASSVRIRDQLAGPGIDEHTSVSRLAPRDTVDRFYALRLFRRGRHRERHFILESEWPLGFYTFRRADSFDAIPDTHDGILVAPRPELPAGLREQLHRWEGEDRSTGGFQRTNTLELRHLREFRPGDSPKSIHWPSTTRSGTLTVRENDPPQPQPRRYGLLLHDFRPPGTVLRPGRFETILRYAAGLVSHCRDHDIALTFRLACHGDIVWDAPAKSGYGELLDLLAEAHDRSRLSLTRILADPSPFRPCDRVFVFGPSDHAAWDSIAKAALPGCICLSPPPIAHTGTSPVASRRDPRGRLAAKRKVSRPLVLPDQHARRP